jgi:hypothetical protein
MARRDPSPQSALGLRKTDCLSEQAIFAYQNQDKCHLGSIVERGAPSQARARRII